MKQRWLVAVVGLPLLLAVLLLCPPWATMLFACALSGAAAWELLRTAAPRAPAEARAAVIAAAAGEAGVLFFAAASDAPVWVGCLLPWGLAVFLFASAVARHGTAREFPFPELCVGLLGGVGFPLGYGCLALLRAAEPWGRVYVLAPFVIAFLGDTFSMYCGMWFGKRKCAPRVSPNKTWAGTIAGPAASALGMALLGLAGARLLGYAADIPRLLLTGALANLFGQLGDLSMSLIKREAGIKDYSHLFLTHGGVLDRFDSTLFILPVVFFLKSGGWI